MAVRALEFFRDTIDGRPATVEDALPKVPVMAEFIAAPGSVVDQQVRVEPEAGMAPPPRRTLP